MENTNSSFSDARIKDNLAAVKNKLIVLSGKGGVGKSTVAVNLSVLLEQKGLRVGLLDTDIHGPNVAKMLGLEGKNILADENRRIKPYRVYKNLEVISLAFLLPSSDKPVVWRGPLKTSLIRQFLSDVEWGELDYLIIDSPPGTGDEPLSVCQLVPNLNMAIVVTTPQEVALLDVRKSIAFLQELNIPFVGIVENMSGLICPYCGKKIDLFKSGAVEKTAEEFGIEFLGKLPLEPEAVVCSDRGQPLVLTDKAGSFRQVFFAIGEKIRKHENSA